VAPRSPGRDLILSTFVNSNVNLENMISLTYVRIVACWTTQLVVILQALLKSSNIFDLGKVILTSVVGTNSDPSDAIHMDIISFFLLPPQVAPGTLRSTPRQISRVKSSPPGGIELFTFRLT